jgi:hypothetical protein
MVEIYQVEFYFMCSCIHLSKMFMKTKVYVVSLILSLVFKTVFGIFLAPLCLETSKCVLKEYSDPML